MTGGFRAGIKWSLEKVLVCGGREYGKKKGLDLLSEREENKS